MASAFIGGEYFSRDFKGDEKSRDPLVPVKGAKQREALRFLLDDILSDEAFQFSPQLLRRLTAEHWSHWGSGSFSFFGGLDSNVYDRVLRIQFIALNHCLSADVLRRIQHQQLMVDQELKPMRVSEIFRSLMDSVWSEVAKAAKAETDALTCSTIRRNLQRAHLRRLSRMVIGQRRNAFGDIYGMSCFWRVVRRTTRQTQRVWLGCI